MKRPELNRLLNKLNSKLSQKGEKRKLILCGGAALILLNLEKVETVDVDLVDPSRDVLLQNLAKEIATDEKSIREDWLNSNASSFFKKHNPLPKNWEKRLDTVYESSHLTVKALSREDLLFTKICSHIDREMDEQDIKVLTHDEAMFNRAIEKVTKLKKYQNSIAKIIIAELRTRLGFDDEKKS